MKISYNWLKWYIPDLPALLTSREQAGAPDAKKLADIVTYHLAEVESLENKPDGDVIFDIKILPNRAHDLLSHQGVARELASLLNIKYVDPTPKYKIPPSKPATLKIEVESDKCRRYVGRIVRNVKVEPSPEWVVKHLESIGQRSINNMVDAANIVMFDCGQPTHVFDLNKIKNNLIIRQAKDGETLTTLDNKDCKFKSSDLVIADSAGVLAVAGVKGGKLAEVDKDTTDVILEVANFDPTSVRKTAQALNIVTDAKKRFENDLCPELCSYAMLELSALILEMYPEAIFEDIVDVYPKKQEERKLFFSLTRISSILGIEVSTEEVEDILKRYNFIYIENNGTFEIVVPFMRLDLVIEEDMAEEIGRILGYDRIKGEIPKINFQPKQNEVYNKISWARHKLLEDGYSEVMNSTFRNIGEVSVLASASDKKFLRTNLSDGLKESIKLNNINAPLLRINEIKIFETGTVFKKDIEEIHVAFGDKKEIKEMSLEEFIEKQQEHSLAFLQTSSGIFRLQNVPVAFHMWSLFPFITRDIAVWVILEKPGEVNKNLEAITKILDQEAGELLNGKSLLFDNFVKGDKRSYAFRLIFQSFKRTLTDVEINEIMNKINNKIKENNNLQLR